GPAGAGEAGRVEGRGQAAAGVGRRLRQQRPAGGGGEAGLAQPGLRVVHRPAVRQEELPPCPRPVRRPRPWEVPMKKQVLSVAAGVILGVAGYALAQHAAGGGAGPEGTKLRTVLEQLLAEKLDGKEAKVTVLEVEKAPGTGSAPHRHPGPVVGYVLEGELEVAVGDAPVKVYKKGEAWFEAARALHRVSRNHSRTRPARFLAFMLHGKDEK